MSLMKGDWHEFIRKPYKKIHSVKDVTEGFIKHCGYEPKEQLLEVDLTSVCYGVTERTKKMFWKSEFEKIKKDGYYMS